MISLQRGGSICVTLLGRIGEQAVLVGALQPDHVFKSVGPHFRIFWQHPYQVVRERGVGHRIESLESRSAFNREILDNDCHVQ